MDGNTGNVYPKHKQRNNSDSKIQTNWKKSKKSKNQSINLRNTIAARNSLEKKPRRRRNKKKKKFKKSINQSQEKSPFGLKATNHL